MIDIEDTYHAKTLTDARAAAMQAIETMHEDGYGLTTISAEREADGYVIRVVYRRGEE